MASLVICFAGQPCWIHSPAETFTSHDNLWGGHHITQFQCRFFYLHGFLKGAASQTPGGCSISCVCEQKSGHKPLIATKGRTCNPGKTAYPVGARERFLEFLKAKWAVHIGGEIVTASIKQRNKTIVICSLASTSSAYFSTDLLSQPDILSIYLQVRCS